MKRMVKNGDLIDVEPDGSITVAGKPIGGGGGSDYTAGSNIEISDSKEIAVKSALTGVESVKFSPDNGCIIKSGGDSSLTLKGGWEPYYSHPSIWLYPADGKTYGIIQLLFENKTSSRFGVNFNFATMKSGDSLYAFFLRGALPPRLPEANGTYILKASVSGGVVSYTWELQQ